MSLNLMRVYMLTCDLLLIGMTLAVCQLSIRAGVRMADRELRRDEPELHRLEITDKELRECLSPRGMVGGRLRRAGVLSAQSLTSWRDIQRNVTVFEWSSPGRNEHTGEEGS